MLFLLLITSLSPVLTNQQFEAKELLSGDEQMLTESERLVQASQHWMALEPSSHLHADIQASSGVLRLQAGEFDPLQSVGPSLDKAFLDEADPARTGLALIQLHEHNGGMLDELAKQYSFTPLDFISDE